MDSTIYACEILPWNNIVIEENTELYDTLTNEQGDTLVIHYNVIIGHESVRDTFITTCELSENGEESIEYFEMEEVYPSAQGCDSIVLYHYAIQRVAIRDTFVNSCDPYTWRGITVYDDAILYDTLQSIHGCDSITRCRVSFLNGPIAVEESVACDSIVWKGIRVTQDTFLCDTMYLDKGCTSLYCYQFTIHHSVVKDSAIYACDSFPWHGEILRESCLKSDTFSTIHGCDSIIHYAINIGKTFVTDTLLSVCGSFTYQGITFLGDTAWNETLQTTQGCDSIIRYHLTIHHGTITDSSVTALDTFFWQGKAITEDAQWNDTLQTVQGCDSIIRYQLTMQYTPRIGDLTIADSLLLGKPNETIEVSYSLSKGEVSRYDFTRGGVPICSDTLKEAGVAYLTIPGNLSPGEYTTTLSVHDRFGTSANQDFTFHVAREDNGAESFYQKRWNDLLICLNEGKQFSSYQWYKNRKKIEGATFQYYCDLNGLAGEYMVQVTERQGAKYFIEPKYFTRETMEVSVTATPNPARRYEKVTVTINGLDNSQLENARLVIYHTNGAVEWMKKPVSKETMLTLPAGEYVVVLTVNDGKNINCKILVK
jgi:hypothetical protein